MPADFPKVAFIESNWFARPHFAPRTCNKSQFLCLRTEKRLYATGNLLFRNFMNLRTASILHVLKEANT